MNEFVDDEEVNVVSEGFTFTCVHVKHSFEVPTGKVSISMNARGIVATFACICGREHEVVIS